MRSERVVIVGAGAERYARLMGVRFDSPVVIRGADLEHGLRVARRLRADYVLLSPRGSFAMRHDLEGGTHA